MQAGLWPCYTFAMLVTAATNLPLGWPAPNFELNDTTGQLFKLSQLSSFPGLLLMFISQACPVAKHVWPVINHLHQDFKRQVAFVGINSLAKDRDSVESHAAMSKTVVEYQIDFPYLADENQRVSKQYQVTCLPDFYLFRNEGGHHFCLQYHGRLNDNYDHPELVSDDSLKRALLRQKSSLTPLMYQKPAFGYPVFTS